MLPLTLGNSARGAARLLVLCAIVLHVLGALPVMTTVPLTRKVDHEKRIHERIAYRMANSPQRLFSVEGDSPNNSTENIDVYGDLTRTAAYYIKIHTGSGQEFNVDIDTGSSDLVIFADSCRKGCENLSDVSPSCPDVCAPAARKYTLNHSPDFQVVPCDSSCSTSLYQQGDAYCLKSANLAMCPYKISYLDGTGFRGGMVEDSVSFPDIPGFTGKSALGLIFYQADKRSATFPPADVEGILGLGFVNLAATKRNVLDDLKVDLFALKLGPTGGLMTLHGVDPALYTGDIVWADIPHVASGVDYMAVKLLSIWAGNDKVTNLPTNGQNAVVDSGSTHIVVPPDVKNKICQGLVSSAKSTVVKNLLQDLCAGKDIVHPGQAILDKFPSLGFEVRLQTGLFDDKKFTLPLEPAYYLRDRGSGFVLGITAMSTDRILLGDVFMQRYYTIFDRKQRRIGFAKSLKDFDPPPIWLYLAIAVAGLVSLTTSIFLCCICWTWLSNGAWADRSLKAAGARKPSATISLQEPSVQVSSDGYAALADEAQ